jgi:hypothetical protein
MLFKRLFARRAESKAANLQPDQVQRALESPEVNVRRDACRALTDLGLLRGLAEEDGDAGVRELAEARYRRLLCGLDAHAPSPETRLAALETATDQSLIAHAAAHASEPQLRLAAIARLEDEAALAACATADEIAANRLAAAERIGQRAALEQVAKQIGKRDKRVYRLVRERLKVIAEQQERPRRARETGETLCERLERLGRFENWVQDRAVLEHLEQQWQEIDADTDAALRNRFQTSRQRFNEGFEAYQRAHAEEVAEQESRQAAARTRRDLIDALRQLSEHASTLDLQSLEDEAKRLHDAWQQAGTPDASAARALEADYQALTQTLDARRRQLEEAQQQAQAAERLLADLRRMNQRAGAPERRGLDTLRKRRRALPASAPAADGDAQAGAASAILSEIDELLKRLGQRFERHQTHVERKLETLPERLDELGVHLDAGELKRADALYQSISATLEQARGAGFGREHVAAADARLKQIAPQLRELRQWRRWSADEHRAMLCAEIEALAADDDHADEPSINRLQELKEQWQTLDRQGAPADDALWARFRQASDHIRERCQPYLEAQATLRSENRKQRESLAKKLELFLDKVDWERVDWKKLHRAEREMRHAWGSLVEAPGGETHGARDRAIEGRFRRGLRRLDRTLAEERERNQAEKHQLLEQMRALADEPDLRRAVEEAKRLQQQWHTTVPARHRDENALWQQFRAASDAIFARRSAEYEARGATLRSNQESREAICEELLALAESAASSSRADFEQRVSALKTRWNDTEALPLPRQAQGALNQRWRDALTAVRSRLAALREAERWAGLERLARRSGHCDELARQLAADPDGNAADYDAALQAWDALPGIEDSQLAEAAEQAFAPVREACGNPSARSALADLLEQHKRQRESLCLELEIISQVESPSALQADRMQRQVERLREHLSESAQTRGEDITELLRDWYLATPAAASTALDERFQRVSYALRERAPDDLSTASAGA